MRAQPDASLLTPTFALVTASSLAYFMGYGMLLPGRRVLVVGGSGILAASYVTYVVADALLPLLALRVVSGVGEAAMFVGAATAIQDLAPPAPASLIGSVPDAPRPARSRASSPA